MCYLNSQHYQVKNKKTLCREKEGSSITPSDARMLERDILDAGRADLVR